MRSSVQMFCIEQGIEGIMDVAITAALKSKDYDSLTTFIEWVEKWDKGIRVLLHIDKWEDYIQCPMILNVLYAAQETISYYEHQDMTFKKTV